MRVFRRRWGSVVAAIVAVLGSGALFAQAAHAQLTLHVAPGVSGGRVIGGFRRNPDGSWSTTVDAARNHRWVFRQLFVDNRRYILARSPNTGQFFVRKPVLQGDIETKGQWAGKSKTAFGFFPGDLRPWPNLQDVNLKLYFSWNSGLYLLKSVDEKTHVATLAGPAVWPMPRSAGQCYLVENHPGALDAPGEWQLDRTTGRLTIIPFAEENIGQLTAVAPLAEHLVLGQGDPERGRFLEHIRFEGISFQHGAWSLPPEGHGDPQAESTLDAALQFDGARHVTIERCEVAHVGNYAIWFRHGCVANRVVANHLHDLGGGGARIGVHLAPATAMLSCDNVLDNNFIHDGGQIHPGVQLSAGCFPHAVRRARDSTARRRGGPELAAPVGGQERPRARLGVPALHRHSAVGAGPALETDLLPEDQLYATVRSANRSV